MERILDYFHKNKEEIVPDYIQELELQTTRFASALTINTMEQLLETDNGLLRMYHVGSEKITKPGLIREERFTGKESVIIQYRYGENLYQLLGIVESTTGQFKFSQIREHGRDGRNGYVKVRTSELAHVIQSAADSLAAVVDNSWTRDNRED